MKKIFFSIFLLATLVASAQNEAATNDPVDYVNPLMGTDSKPDMSNGNTYPAIALPWGMNLWTPQTGRMGDGWVYQYTADRINGFKQTHQPSPWMNDYGAFAIMPITGKIRFEEKDRQSWFSHKAEISKPYYYSVYLADPDVTTEITPTERAASFRFTFPKADSSSVIVDALDRGSHIKIIPSENKIIGYTTRNSGGVSKNFKNYFVIIFNKPFDYTYTFRDSIITKDAEQKCNHAGAIIGFKNTRKGDIISAKIASSYISFDQATINLKEIGNDNFETTKSKAKDAWNNVLGKVKVSGGTVAQMRTFYSCLYRMVFFPLKFYEKNADGKIVHYSPYTGKTEDGYMFGGTGFWDTFRALYPFLNLVYPSIVKEMQQGLVNDYKEGGFLPEWSAPGYRDVMVGNNSASIVAEAYLKGGRGYDVNLLFEALKHGANNEGPEGTGRTGVKYYNDLGYVPYNVNINENAARTLEYAYDDYCIYQLGKALGKPEAEIGIYKKRAMNYKNLFDSSHLLMRGKNENGTFQSPFNPFKWGDAFTEGNSWHYSWSVFQDISGLIKLMGGKEKFVQMLDSVFKMPPTFDDSYYGGVIHEIREMQIANMGQYAHGNQPIQHMIYLYDYAGEPWKTQYWARETMNKLYKATPDGYCGDEDNGQTSAWYVFSALGFYPVTPASTQYAAGAPLFKHAEINFENGKTLSINAANNSADKRFTKSVTYNGKPYTKNYFDHFDLQKGGTINVEMSESPNKKRGTHNSEVPFSLSASQGDWNNAFSAEDISRDTISKGGYTLVFINKDAALNNDVKQHMINTFFSVYPKEVKAYNRNSLKKVIIIIDPEYDGVAATSGSIVRVNPEWMHNHPEDVDVVTHEVMHIVQSYPGGAGPGWITEGIADYVRNKMGVNNEAGGWQLPGYNSKQNYTDAYRVTARFLQWIEEKYKKDLVQKLDADMRNKKYSPAFWKTETGKTVDQLWAEYAEVNQKNIKSFEISGSINSVEDGTEIYLNTWVNSKSTDTAIIRNGKFKFVGTVSTPTPAVLNFGEQNPNAKFFWLENIQTNFTGFGRNLDKGVIKNSGDNREFEDYKNTTDSFNGNDSLINAFNVSYIKNHPDSYISGVALLMVMSKVQPAQSDSLYQSLSPKIKKSFYGEEFKNQPEAITRNGVTLYFNDKEKLFTDEYKKKFIDAYFEIYPPLINQYPNSPKAVTITIDKKYSASASASAGELMLSDAWSEKNPGDVSLLKLQLQLVAKNDFDNALLNKPAVSIENESLPDTITRNGLTLYFNETFNYFTAADKKIFIDSFFNEYPVLIKQYNSNSSKIVGFTFDKANGITADYRIDNTTVSKNWKSNPYEPVINITQMLTEIVLNKDVPSWITKSSTKSYPLNKPDTISRDGLTLYFDDPDKSFTDAYKKRFVDTYFEQYPKLIKKYNTNSPKALTFNISKSYTGIAVNYVNSIEFNPAWFETNPEDIDVITHELMHSVQGYGYNNVPMWVTEGIADYVRATEGINNEKGNWSMPDYNPTQNYENSYRITARFFVWITQNYKSDFVNMLDDACRKQNYSDATWKNITGKTLDELWTAYAANPALK